MSESQTLPEYDMYDPRGDDDDRYYERDSYDNPDPEEEEE